MDKMIFLTTSSIDDTKFKTNRDMISFHNYFKCNFNDTVCDKVGIEKGMFAKVSNVDLYRRTMTIVISSEKPSFEKRKWHQIIDSQTNINAPYLYVKATNLITDFGIALSGAFNYRHYLIANNCIAVEILF